MVTSLADLTTIEIFASILILISAIKIITILIKPSAWMNGVVRKLWKNPMLMSIVSLILGGIVFYYLIQALSITEILAVTLFVMLLIAMGFAIYAKEVMSMAEKIYKQKGLIKKSLLYIIIWVALLIWGVKEIFFTA